MWQVVLVSLIVLGVHQLIPRDTQAGTEAPPSNATKHPETTTEHSSTSILTPNAPKPQPGIEIGVPTPRPIPSSMNVPKVVPPPPQPSEHDHEGRNKDIPDFYTYTDPTTNKKYEIPQLGDCNPYDGYMRVLNPGTGQPEFSNEGPIEFRYYNLPLLHYGFTWTGAPSNDPGLLARINGSVTAAEIRGEFNQKLVQLGTSSVTEFDWTDLKNRANQQWPQWPVDKTGNGEARLTVSLNRILYAFQLVLKCGPFTLYTDQIHWIEVYNGVCDSGDQVFEKCEVCWDLSASCPLLIED